MTDDEIRAWIDNASYEELLKKWRFALAGDPFFLRPMGDYYSRVMARRRKEVGPEEASSASKRIGLER